MTGRRYCRHAERPVVVHLITAAGAAACAAPYELATTSPDVATCEHCRSTIGARP